GPPPRRAGSAVDHHPRRLLRPDAWGRRFHGADGGPGGRQQHVADVDRGSGRAMAGRHVLRRLPDRTLGRLAAHREAAASAPRPAGRSPRLALGRPKPRGLTNTPSFSLSGSVANSRSNGTSRVPATRAGGRRMNATRATTLATLDGSAAFASPHRFDSRSRFR